MRFDLKRIGERVSGEGDIDGSTTAPELATRKDIARSSHGLVLLSATSVVWEKYSSMYLT